jgi:cytochrome c oxidase cbb3-type subunit 1
MERLMMRGGAWLAIALALLLAAAASADWAFSVHMVIACLAALIAAFASAKGFDFVGQRYPALSSQAASTYDDDLIRLGVIATIFWGLAGFLAGLYIALQLAFPALNLNLASGAAAAAHLGGDLRLRRQRADRHQLLRRPAHLPRAPAFGGNLAWFVFWGYQLFIVLAATGYLLGITQARNMPSRNGMSTCG